MTTNSDRAADALDSVFHPSCFSENGETDFSFDDRDRLIAVIASALADERKEAIQDCIRAIDVIADMTTEPQASCYRFVVHRLRSLLPSKDSQLEEGSYHEDGK
jgi:hypothetical protein